MQQVAGFAVWSQENLSVVVSGLPWPMAEPLQFGHCVASVFLEYCRRGQDLILQLQPREAKPCRSRRIPSSGGRLRWNCAALSLNSSPLSAKKIVTHKLECADFPAAKRHQSPRFKRYLPVLKRSAPQALNRGGAPKHERGFAMPGQNRAASTAHTVQRCSGEGVSWPESANSSQHSAVSR